MLFSAFEMMNATCSKCIPPCDRPSFSTRLSSTYLSALNIDRLVLTDGEKRSTVKMELENAIETLQRSKREILTRDNYAMNAIIMARKQTKEAINDLHKVMQNFTAFSEENKILDYFVTATGYFLDDYNFFKSIIEKMAEQHYLVNTNLASNRLFENIKLTQIFKEEFMSCLSSELKEPDYNYQSSRCTSSSDEESSSDGTSSSDDTSSSECIDMFVDRRCNKLLDYNGEIKSVLPVISSSTIAYERTVSYLPNDALSDNIDHEACMNATTWLNNTGTIIYEFFVNLTEEKQYKIDQLSQISDIGGIQEQLRDIYNMSLTINEYIESDEMLQFIEVFKNLNASSRSFLSCQWMQEPIEKIFYYDVEEPLSTLQYNREHFNTVQQLVSFTISQYNKQFEPDLLAIEEYLAKNITKSNLANKLTTARNEKRQEKFFSNLYDCGYTIEELVSEFEREISYVKDLYLMFASPLLPLLTYSTLNSTIIGKEVLKYVTTNKLENSNKSISTLVGEVMDEQFKVVSCLFHRNIILIEEAELDDKLSIERTVLRQYLNSLALDTEFFM